MYKHLSDVTLLYVEDDQGTRENLLFYLNSSFKKVFVATNGIERLELFYAHPSIDLILTDIQMPLMNGLEMVRTIKAKYPHLPFVITTAYNDQTYMLESIDLGVLSYVCKPIDIASLFEKLALTCKRHIEARLSPALLEQLHTLHDNDMQSLIALLDKAINESNASTITQLSEGFSYDKQQKGILHDGALVLLSQQESTLLETLLANRNTFVSYEQLMHALSADHPSIDVLRTVVKSLRHKTHKKAIINLSGLGYKLV